MKLLIFSSLISIVYGQQLLSLSSFQGANFKNDLNAIAPFGVFVSAHSDSEDLLSKIFLIKNDNEKISLQEIKERTIVPTTGELQALTITKSAYLTTKLTSEQLQILTGVMFLSSTAQLLNKNFHVADISFAQSIDIQQYGNVPSTILFLNTHMDTIPVRSSIISQWKQDPSSSVYIYQGFPYDAVEQMNTQIFSNPMETSINQFFPTVEKFSLVMVAFYMKTFKGGPVFRIEPGYYSVDSTTLSAYTTTGLYMKETGRPDSSNLIHTKRNMSNSPICGANILGSLPADGIVTVGTYGGAHEEFSVSPKGYNIPWNSKDVGENIQISSLKGKDGQFYVQYFVSENANIETSITSGIQTTSKVLETTMKSTVTSSVTVKTTIAGRQSTFGTSPGHVETTTKSSGTNLSFVSLVISLIFIGIV